jgi:hypothetical protein
VTHNRFRSETRKIGKIASLGSEKGGIVACLPSNLKCNEMSEAKRKV